MAKKRNKFGIVRLNITLLYVSPKVTRRMDVPSDTNLEDLHYYIQAAMGWDNDHLWGFEARRHWQRAHWSIDFFDDDSTLDANILDVLSFLAGKSEFTYIYDFGESWTHRIRIGKIQPARDDRCYPYLVSGTGRCPPEDIGGAWGYQALLNALDDPDAEFRIDYPGFFQDGRTWDPDDAELEARRADLARYS
ncbi:MAG: plasmid pRiA4b ORF-3 family protein [Albidovulum sp.]|nr:plasmid pRiA4b ORF-3 family protein [Albidovulum sp.]